MNVLSLFDGMSCLQIALNRSGIKYSNYYASEIKKYAIEVTQKNYPDTIQLGDIKKVKGKDLPPIDLIAFGSPCQDFSIANKERKGLEGIKSGLFFEAVRLLDECKPKYFLMENVSMTIKDCREISKKLGVNPIEINSSLVSAQMRKRMYWTNIRGDENMLFWNEISQPKDKRIKLSDIIERESRPLKTPDRMIHRYIKTGFATLIFKDETTFLRVKEATKLGYVDVSEGEGIDLSFLTSKTRGGRHMKEKCNCLMRSSNEYYVFTGDDVRYFTQTELERLQTVPEGYTSCLSRNHAACVLGDGWTIDVICHILKGIKDV